MQEIERKWLVKLEFIPRPLASYSHKELVAGYFKDKDGEDVRIRKEGNKNFKVKKTGHGLVKDIGPGDIEISKKEFDSLWSKTEKRRISKRRHYIKYGKFTIELDVYHDFKDFYTVEVEFKSVTGANRFTPPKWFGREVTDHIGYSSNSLATKGIPR